MGRFNYEGLDEKLLLKKDGTSFVAQDIGTALMQFDDYPSLIN